MNYFLHRQRKALGYSLIDTGVCCLGTRAERVVSTSVDFTHHRAAIRQLIGWDNPERDNKKEAQKENE